LLSSPRRASRAGSVKDVSGRFVKDVMGLNTLSKRGDLRLRGASVRLTFKIALASNCS